MKTAGIILFVLAALAGIGTAVNTSGYEGDKGLAWNLTNAKAFPASRTDKTPCPRPNPPAGQSADYSVPMGCPTIVDAWTPSSQAVVTSVTRPGVPLGAAFGASGAAAVIGLGMLALGGKRPRSGARRKG